MSYKTEEDLSMIVAVDEAGGFAAGNQIPWSYGEDWSHFKSVTDGNICIMGRGTYEDIAERRSKRSPTFKKLLTGRTSYVISSTLAGTKPQGTEGAYTSVRQILDELKIPKDSDQEIYILGGGRLYTQYIISCKQVWMTIVPGYHNCDKYFHTDYLDEHFDVVEGRKTPSKLTFVRWARPSDYVEVYMHNKFIDEMLKWIPERVIERNEGMSMVSLTHLRRQEIGLIQYVSGRILNKKRYVTGDAYRS